MTTKKPATLFALALTLLLFVPTAANAAISVETFTCSGQSGTAAVENGAAFSCQASLRNEDTQNSANVATVTLLVNGNWAEQTSYAGSGFSTSISAGASTTAIFSGIRSVAPGATNKFQSIQIDSTSDTFVTNTNINAITIKSMTVTASESSASQGGQFDVSATVIAGGDLGNVDMTWSASGGCSLVAGHTATKSVGSLAHNAEATRTWRVSQGSADCVSTVTVSGTSSSVTTSKSKSVTVSFTSSTGGGGSSSGSTGGGGGGGAGGVAAKGETKTAKQISPGAAATLEFTKSAVSSIAIDVLQAASNVSVTVEEVTTTTAPAPSGSVYKYLDIKAINISESGIKSATVRFAVGKSWLEGKDRNSVRLLRYANAWQELSTQMLDENATDVRYTATTPGFSTFAITARPAAEERVCAQVITPATDGKTCREFPTPCDVPAGWTAVDRCPEKPQQVPVQVPGIGEVQIPKPLVDYGPVIIVVVLVVIAVLGWFHYHGPGKKVKKFTYEFKSK